MTVETILRTKGRDVVTVRETDTLGEAARLLDSHAIGALLVEDGAGRPIAVLSERDLVREMALHGAACLQRRVAQALTQAFIVAGRDIELNALMVLMTERRVRHVPIIEDERLLGIISIGDVVKAKIADMEAETAALQAYIRS